MAICVLIGAGCGSDSSSSTPFPVTEPSAPSAALSLVGLGDSLPGGEGCDCTGYVDHYGKDAASALGTAVAVTNLATNDGVDSAQLLARVQSDPAHRDALGSADLITIQIGFNDWRVCNWPGDDACWSTATAGVETNLAATLAEISTLRGEKPTVVRVLTYPNMWIGPIISPQPPFLDDPEFQTFYSGQLDQFNAMACRVAKANGVECVDLVEAFNGPGGDAAPDGLIGPDNKHPTAAGHELIAATLDAAGYAPLAEP